MSRIVSEYIKQQFKIPLPILWLYRVNRKAFNFPNQTFISVPPHEKLRLNWKSFTCISSKTCVPIVKATCQTFEGGFPNLKAPKAITYFYKIYRDTKCFFNNHKCETLFVSCATSNFAASHLASYDQFRPKFSADLTSADIKVGVLFANLIGRSAVLEIVSFSNLIGRRQTKR